MKVQTFKSLGLNVNLSVPTDHAEFDTLAKKQGACVEEAVRNVVYRGSLAEFRDVLLHGRDEVKSTDGTVTQKAIEGLDSIFKMERAVKPVLDKENKPKKNSKGEELTAYAETEEAFFDRIVATHKITEADQQKFANIVASQLVFDPSATERKPAAPKKLAAKYSENAKKIIAGGQIDKLNQRLHKAIGKQFTATGEEAKDIESLGWLIKEFVEWNEQQTINKLVS